ncbi:hypothetical protein BJY00DRAFT_270866 [Aspergillus carlsbadensis]|nr:hypothetical protein BJY00DRAFT_270866 [Aspergillus carlsbadensis]
MRSASVLLFAYAGTIRGLLRSVQSSSIIGTAGSRPTCLAPYAIAANELVSTTRFTPASRAARITLFVPSTAGIIKSYSSFGGCAGNGEAMCWTYVTSFRAVVQPSFEERSACVNSIEEMRCSGMSACAREDLISSMRDGVRRVVRIR